MYVLLNRNYGLLLRPTRCLISRLPSLRCTPHVLSVIRRRRRTCQISFSTMFAIHLQRTAFLFIIFVHEAAAADDEFAFNLFSDVAP